MGVALNPLLLDNSIPCVAAGVAQEGVGPSKSSCHTDWQAHPGDRPRGQEQRSEDHPRGKGHRGELATEGRFLFLRRNLCLYQDL